MKILGVIPARFGSTRFPGKPLVSVAGKPLLQWVIEGSKKSKLLSEVLVATDDQRIADLAIACGVRAIMTESNLQSGTDRIWAAVKNEDCEAVINIQGDEPLVSGELIDSLAQVFIGDSQIEMATLGHSLAVQDLNSMNVVKLLVNSRDEAIYFSRFPIPYSRQSVPDVLSEKVLRHVGMYGYRKIFLPKFCSANPADLELAESLEQLRALDLGAKIKVVRTTLLSIGVDAPEDIEKVERLLKL